MLESFSERDHALRDGHGDDLLSAEPVLFEPIGSLLVFWIAESLFHLEHAIGQGLDINVSHFGDFADTLDILDAVLDLLCHQGEMVHLIGDGRDTLKGSQGSEGAKEGAFNQ